MSTHGQFANPLTPSQPQSPCKLFIQPLFGGRFFLLQLTPGRQANLGLRLYNRPSAVAFVIRLRTTMRKTAEERFHTLARGWLAYPVTPTHTHLPPKSGCRCRLMSVCKSNNTNANNLYNRPSAVVETSREAHFVTEFLWLQTDR